MLMLPRDNITKMFSFFCFLGPGLFPFAKKCNKRWISFIACPWSVPCRNCFDQFARRSNSSFSFQDLSSVHDLDTVEFFSCFLQNMSGNTRKIQLKMLHCAHASFLFQFKLNFRPSAFSRCKLIKNWLLIYSPSAEYLLSNSSIMLLKIDWNLILASASNYESIFYEILDSCSS